MWPLRVQQTMLLVRTADVPLREFERARIGAVAHGMEVEAMPPGREPAGVDGEAHYGHVGVAADACGSNPLALASDDRSLNGNDRGLRQGGRAEGCCEEGNIGQWLHRPASVLVWVPWHDWAQQALIKHKSLEVGCAANPEGGTGQRHGLRTVSIL